jgi:hypothetical protein
MSCRGIKSSTTLIFLFVCYCRSKKNRGGPRLDYSCRNYFLTSGAGAGAAAGATGAAGASFLADSM